MERLTTYVELKAGDWIEVDGVIISVKRLRTFDVRLGFDGDDAVIWRKEVWDEMVKDAARGDVG